MFKVNPGSFAQTWALTCVSFLLGAFLAVVAIGLFQPLQQSISWRSDRLISRAPISQLNVERALLGYWRRAVALTPTTTWVAIGDSHLHGLQGKAISPDLVNLSIGGLSAGRFNDYLSRDLFPLPLAPSGYLLHLGHNDLEEGVAYPTIEKSLESVLNRLGADLPITVVELFPRLKSASNSVYSKGRSDLNLFLRRKCEVMPKCIWLPVDYLKNEAGDLNERYVENDGVHLNVEGYQRFLDELKVSLTARPNQGKAK
jgi:lysophospholipase L1-like esterase